MKLLKHSVKKNRRICPGKNKEDDPDYGYCNEADEFVNDHMEELQEVIIKTIKQVEPSDYHDQQKYLKSVFDRCGDSCWSYVQDIFNDPGISPELSDKITETMIKDTAVIAAMAVFLEWGLSQKRDDDTDGYDVKVDILYLDNEEDDDI